MSQRRAAGGTKTTSASNPAEEVQPLASKRKAAPMAVLSTGSLSLDPTSPTAEEAGTIHQNDENGKEALTLEERYEKEKFDLKVRHWRESPFAVGLKNVTWVEEKNNQGCCSLDEHGEGADCLCFSAMVCPYTGAGRVGNMIVLKQTTEWVEEVEEDEETGEEKVVRSSRPKLQIVMGPYWPLLCTVTYPLIFGISGWTLMQAIPGKPVAVVFVWLCCTIGLIVALAFTAFRDPGILYRHHRPPAQSENTWRWSDQGLTFRPRGAVYDPDTGVVVEGFDHTCPWTGTAIGRKNMLSFQFFVCLVFVCMVFDILLLTKTLDGH